MSYETCLLYSQSGDFIGYVILNPEVPGAPERKLQSTNVYKPGEEHKLQDRLSGLSEHVSLSNFWPNPKDPEVLQLLADKSFCPIQYVDRQVVDDENSFYVWKKEQETDEYGNPIFDLVTGQPKMVQGSEIDEQASVIRFKIASVPAKPTDEMFRIKQACEVVARNRAQAAGML